MIHADSIVKDYGDFRALDGISFNLEDSGIFGIVGHNGAGKTTLLKIMAGLIAPTSGELIVGGVDAVKNPDLLKMSLGYLPEESHLYENMTVDGYLSFFGEIYGLSVSSVRAKSRKLLKDLDLDAGNKKIGELSKGMKRKVAIARSLIHDPAYLVYDEPASGLDPMTSKYISEFLVSMKSKGKKTIILSAHNLYQIEELCDKVMILQRGKEVVFGTMDELRGRFGSIYYEVEFTLDDESLLRGIIESYQKSAGVITAKVSDTDSLNSLTKVVSSGGGLIKRVESHFPSLEDILFKIG
ncbi:ABC-2 type transport system ATP-binding protein [Methanomicrobium sp. W14]|uniref:ABC transporter ATP-binding protein n=1 Tax=Methanomicrobium sp. W14 TaxID=2817839 RepID=UPI001AE34325|nr:ABC transporter ATP-binding protein [Methanomicrobium sp. W14]MBP2133050.1 ABC-2 type transport system ATP-binding protein [Methanomicrobium sp. W14]